MSDADAKKAPGINEWLRTERPLYNQATHRQVQRWLDPGNAYLHNADEWQRYTPWDISRTLTTIKDFLARHDL